MRAAIWIVAGVVAAGCTRNDGVTQAYEGPDCLLVSSLRVDPLSMTLHPGDSAQFSVSSLPACAGANQSFQPAVATWAISNSSVARIDASTGSVRAIDTGLVTITAASKQDPNVKSAGLLRVIP